MERKKLANEGMTKTVFPQISKICDDVHFSLLFFAHHGSYVLSFGILTATEHHVSSNLYVWWHKFCYVVFQFSFLKWRYLVIFLQFYNLWLLSVVVYWTSESLWYFSISYFKKIENLLWCWGGERKSNVGIDSGWQMVLGGLILISRACKTATVRRTVQSCFGDDSPSVKLVTGRIERD